MNPDHRVMSLVVGGLKIGAYFKTASGSASTAASFEGSTWS